MQQEIDELKQQLWQRGALDTLPYDFAHLLEPTEHYEDAESQMITVDSAPQRPYDSARDIRSSASLAVSGRTVSSNTNNTTAFSLRRGGIDAIGMETIVDADVAMVKPQQPLHAGTADETTALKRRVEELQQALDDMQRDRQSARDEIAAARATLAACAARIAAAAPAPSDESDSAADEDGAHPGAGPAASEEEFHENENRLELTGMLPVRLLHLVFFWGECLNVDSRCFCVC